MSALSAFTPPDYYTKAAALGPASSEASAWVEAQKKMSCLRLRRPSLPAGGQGVQRGLARPDACMTDIVPHSCTGVRPKPGLSQCVSQIIGEICLTMGGFDQVDGFGLT